MSRGLLDGPGADGLESEAPELTAAFPAHATVARAVPTVSDPPDAKASPVVARRQIVAVGGGKGGIGKSLITSSLGICLARRGRRVVLVDADLGGANLHTALGLNPPKLSLGDFINRRVSSIEEVIMETGVPNLGLISGAHMTI